MWQPVSQRASQRLSHRFYEGEHLPEDVLREAWSLRVEMLTLSRSLDDDWAIFSGHMRKSDRCLFTFHAAGRMQGFFTIAFLPMAHERRRMLLMYSKYFYFRRDYRGHYLTLLAPWRLLPYAFSRYGWRSLHFVTTAFPQSYVSLARTAGRVFSLRDDDTPNWRRQALRTFGQAMCGDAFDADSGLIGGNNVPDAEALPLSEEAKALHARYEALNPRWREGYTMAIMFSVDADLVRHSARRTWRRRRRGVKTDARRPTAVR